LAAVISNLAPAIHNLPLHLVLAGLHPSAEVSILLDVEGHSLRVAVVVWLSSNPQDCGVGHCPRSTPTPTLMVAHRRAPIAHVACQASR